MDWISAVLKIVNKGLGLAQTKTRDGGSSIVKEKKREGKNKAKKILNLGLPGSIIIVALYLIQSKESVEIPYLILLGIGCIYHIFVLRSQK